MNPLQLNVPQPEGAPHGDSDLRAPAVREWLDALPLANAPHAAQQLLDALARTNRTAVDAQTRFTWLALVGPTADDLIATLRNRYTSAPLPLADKQRALAATVRRLLEELAFGYKMLALALYMPPAAPKSPDREFFDALQRAADYLARLLVEAYTLGTPIAAQNWGELHRIYRYLDQGETQHAQTHAREWHRDAAEAVTRTYLRIALLALSNPNHLMHGEATVVYEDLAAWAGKCDITLPARGATLAGRFVVDLAGDAPPHYVSADDRHNAQDPRILDLAPLLSLLDERIASITGRALGAEQTEAMTLANRMRRDMLLRLHRAWGGRTDRRMARTARDARVYLTAGVSACHHFLCGEAPFEPEKDEVRFHGFKLRSTAGQLSLVPKEDEPWRPQEQDQRLARGVAKPRTSRFDTDSPELDVWRKIHSTGTEKAPADAVPAPEPVHATTTWRQRNEGDGGLCLYNQGAAQVKVRVGELVAYKSEAAPGKDWRIGVVRWMQSPAEQALEIGIMLLSEDALSIATRAVHGAGKGSEYFRSLMMPGLDPRAADNTLVVPPAIYDINTVLVVNLGAELFYARLVRLVETTKSFSQFAYEIVDAPQSERERIDSIHKGKL